MSAFQRSDGINPPYGIPRPDGILKRDSRGEMVTSKIRLSFAFWTFSGYVLIDRRAMEFAE
jgi:hypothetical protein